MAQLPGYSDIRNLIIFDAGPDTDYQHGIDPKSIVDSRGEAIKALKAGIHPDIYR